MKIEKQIKYFKNIVLIIFILFLLISVFFGTELTPKIFMWVLAYILNIILSVFVYIFCYFVSQDNYNFSMKNIKTIFSENPKKNILILFISPSYYIADYYKIKIENRYNGSVAGKYRGRFIKYANWLNLSIGTLIFICAFILYANIFTIFIVFRIILTLPRFVGH